MWLAIRRIEENTVILGRSLGNKKLKLPKEHPQYPWSNAEADDGPKKIGDRGDHSSEDVIAFLDSL